MTRRIRVIALIQKLERHGIDLDMPGVGATAADEHLQAIEHHVEGLLKELQPGDVMKPLAGKELWESLAIAIVSLARARRAARLSGEDLKGLVENYCPRLHLPYWTKLASAGTIVGLLRAAQHFSDDTYDPTRLPELSELIKSQGILFWHYPEYHGIDDCWRIVDTKWLDAHADIRRWLTEPWPGGRRCRFCGMQENPRINAIVPVEVERRHGVDKIGDTVVLVSGAVLTHERCRPHWIEWAAIAARYPTQEAAEAADKAAGRKARWPSMQTSAKALEVPNE